MKSEVKNQLSPLEELAAEVIEEKFEELARDCEYRFIGDKGEANWGYHSSSVGYSKAEFRPRLSQGSEKDGVGKD